MKTNFTLSKDLIKNAFLLLGLEIPTSNSNLKKAYRKASIKLHPDTGGDEEKFKLLQNTYQEIIKLSSFTLTDNEFKDSTTSQVTTYGVPLHELGLGLGTAINAIDCPTCDHKGYTIHFGEHIISCDCGNGFVPIKFPCRSCKGTGKFTQKYTKRVVDCLTCKGTGEWVHSSKVKLCPKCNGRTIRWAKTNNEYYEKCDKCNGTGEIAIYNPVFPKARLI